MPPSPTPSSLKESAREEWEKIPNQDVPCCCTRFQEALKPQQLPATPRLQSIESGERVILSNEIFLDFNFNQWKSKKMNIYTVWKSEMIHSALSCNSRHVQRVGAGNFPEVLWMKSVRAVDAHSSSGTEPHLPWCTKHSGTNQPSITSTEQRDKWWWESTRSAGNLESFAYSTGIVMMVCHRHGSETFATLQIWCFLIFIILKNNNNSIPLCSLWWAWMGGREANTFTNNICGCAFKTQRTRTKRQTSKQCFAGETVHQWYSLNTCHTPGEREREITPVILLSVNPFRDKHLCIVLFFVFNRWCSFLLTVF